MLQKLKLLSISLSSFLVLTMPLAFGSSVGAVTQTDINNNVCGGTSGTFSTDQQGNGFGAKGTCTGGESSVNHLITVILNVLSIVVGIIAVIMIIVAGLKYVTSGGKDEGVKSAKNTILYAIIGLVIVALAQIIVHFVLNQANNAATAT